MNDVGQSERATQNRVIALFRGECLNHGRVDARQTPARADSSWR
jgi:hypothetical protein